MAPLPQEEKSKAEEAMKFHTLAEEAADQAEEDEHSGSCWVGRFRRPSQIQIYKRRPFTQYGLLPSIDDKDKDKGCVIANVQ